VSIYSEKAGKEGRAVKAGSRDKKKRVGAKAGELNSDKEKKVKGKSKVQGEGSVYSFQPRAQTCPGKTTRGETPKTNRSNFDKISTERKEGKDASLAHSYPATGSY